MSVNGSVRRGAIIGFGNVAANGHLPGWQAAADFEIVAVVDPDPHRRALAEEAVPGARAYPDLETLLREQVVDFVDVATPPSFHAAAIETAARYGVPVLCEKPLTTSLPEYVHLQQAVRDSGILLHTVHNWKYSEAFQLTRRILAEGHIGTLRSIVFDTARNGCSVSTGENWRVDAGVAGGGILVDHGWHAFYLMLALASERPQQIRALLERRRFTAATVEDTVTCRIDFPSLFGEIRLTWAADERRTRWELVGDEGSLTIDDDRLVRRGCQGEHVQQLGTALSAGSHHADWFAGVIDEFRAGLNDPTRSRDNQAEAELCVLLLHLAYVSGAQDGRAITVPEHIELHGGTARA